MMLEPRLLKKDLFGEVRVESDHSTLGVIRDTSNASTWLRWLARRLLRREAAALAVLAGLDGTPELISASRDRLERSYLAGEPLHQSKLKDPTYFREAFRLLRRMHARNLVHNDLAKEPNLLVTPKGKPAFIDFQLAWVAPRRGRLFRALGHDDLRHLLKHKRTYFETCLTRRERAILAHPSTPSRLWQRIVKPPYLLVTRGLLGWADREGATDRGSRG
jgi:RIO-like serine/threonine protein kinase